MKSPKMGKIYCIILLLVFFIQEIYVIMPLLSDLRITGVVVSVQLIHFLCGKCQLAGKFNGHCYCDTKPMNIEIMN